MFRICKSEESSSSSEDAPFEKSHRSTLKFGDASIDNHNLYLNAAKLSNAVYCVKEKEQDQLKEVVTNLKSSIKMYTNSIMHLKEENDIRKTTIEYHTKEGGRKNSQKFSTVECQKNRYMIVAFRGTANYENVKTNINFDLIRVECKIRDDQDSIEKDYYIHEGFKESFDQIKENVEEVVEEKLKQMDEKSSNLKTIVFTGHSLGGAIATLAYVHFSEKFSIKANTDQNRKKNESISFELVTFGSPKVGDRNFKQYFEVLRQENYNKHSSSKDEQNQSSKRLCPTKHGRFVNNNDIAATWPNPTMTCIYGTVEYCTDFFKLLLNNLSCGNSACQPNGDILETTKDYVHVVQEHKIGRFDGGCLKYWWTAYCCFHGKSDEWGQFDEHLMDNYILRLEEYYEKYKTEGNVENTLTQGGY